MARRVTVVRDPKQQAETTMSRVARKIEFRLEFMREFTASVYPVLSLASFPGPEHLVRAHCIAADTSRLGSRPH